MYRSTRIVLLTLLLAGAVSCRRAEPPSPELSTPVLALKTLEGTRSLYCNVPRAPLLDLSPWPWV